MLEIIDGVNCRWVTDYRPATDSLLTRFDCIAGGELREPRINHFVPEYRDYAFQHFYANIEEALRRAREAPGTQFTCSWHIAQGDLCNWPNVRIGSQLRIRLPNDYTVRDGPRLDVLYGHQHIRPEWLAPYNNSEAREKSITLLKSWLSPEQLAEYVEFKYFSVVGSDSGKRYRLIDALSYNILELDAAGALTGNKFCVVPAQSVAMGDQLLVQKIWLETDETRTLKIANKIVRENSPSMTSLTFADYTRIAVSLFRDSNRFLELLGENNDE